MSEPKRWITTLIQDPDDPEGLLIEFSDDILKEAGWKTGDTLIWIIEDDKVILRKKEE